MALADGCWMNVILLRSTEPPDAKTNAIRDPRERVHGITKVIRATTKASLKRLG